jgi:hypothetical protein
MRIRTVLLATVLAGATFVPLRGVVHVAAANITCRVEASGAPTQPAAVSFPLGDFFADEDVQASGTCVGLTGDVFTAQVTVQSEYLDVATLTWLPTSCPSLTGTMDANVVDPPNVSEATPFASTGCVYRPGDPSLDTVHRAHATVWVGGQKLDDETSAPWSMVGASV